MPPRPVSTAALPRPAWPGLAALGQGVVWAIARAATMAVGLAATMRQADVMPGTSGFHARLYRHRALSLATRRRAELWRQPATRLASLCGCLMLMTLFYAGHSYGNPASPANPIGALMAYGGMGGTADSDDGDDSTTQPMPFEKAGESFPGSAYYYLSFDTAPNGDAAGSLTPGAHWDNDLATRLDAGPAARAVMVGHPVDRNRAITCLTTAIYYEAATEPDAGQKAVAQVILNRVAHPSFPKTVCDVVYQGSELTTGCQFTFTCDGSLLRHHPDHMFWSRAEAVARAALAGYVYAPVGLATHYHTFAVHPAWDDKMNFIGQIGAHRFYRMTGPAGAPGAFRFAYAGREPMPGPHPRSAVTPASALPNDPLAVERAYEAGQAQAYAAARMVNAAVGMPPAPTYAPPAYTPEALHNGGDNAYRARNLPGSEETARPEYQASGNWISQPQ